MTLIDERMKQAASDLHQAVKAVPIPEARQSQDRSGRRLRFAPARAMAVAFVAVLLIGIPALLLSPGSDTSQSTLGGDGSEVTPPGQTDSALSVTAEGFPRLMVDVSQLGDLDLVGVFEGDNVPGDTETHLVAYGDEGEGLDAARIWILTRSRGTDFFRGQTYLEDGWTKVDVNEGRAYTRVGGLVPAVVWDTGSGDDGPAVEAYALNLDMSVLVAVVKGLTENGEGWQASYLPEGLTQTYSGPERVEGSRLSLVWADQEGMGEIGIEFINEGSDPMERSLYALFGVGSSNPDTFGSDQIRGNLAVRIETGIGQGEGSQTVIQWMETPTVLARLTIQGSGIDPDLVVDALRTVSPATWEATLKSVVTTNDLNSTATTVGPADN